ncbi:hypothetical protein [Oscillatoria sp. FACHB-1406]|uniref:hypothetical protein n=1 Tax=Oscillatoria sp. FACHB-1406 TaxID=2692846 RepID=UPI001681E2BC|nr:hypothetical protein [Oscillatoria sp. FACHB-1406]MBD2576934.1 hypothetical protein [Oscillatoria sp. FACHB-1406]
MPLQPLQFIETAYVQVSGDVTIHPSVAIAPGTILRAAPDSRIVIKSGVCIGMGVVLSACGGAIEIETGASLGPGVLIVGRGKIGANACIGGVTTIFNASVEPMQIVPAGSIIGDTSRTLDAEVSIPAPEAIVEGKRPSEIPVESAPEAVEPPAASSPAEEPPASIAPKPPGTPVYGQIHVNQLLYTIFPKGNSINRPSSDGTES